MKIISIRQIPRKYKYVEAIVLEGKILKENGFTYRTKVRVEINNKQITLIKL